MSHLTSKEARQPCDPATTDPGAQLTNQKASKLLRGKPGKPTPSQPHAAVHQKLLDMLHKRPRAASKHVKRLPASIGRNVGTYRIEVGYYGTMVRSHLGVESMSRFPGR